MRIVPVLLFLSTCLQMQPKATNGFSPYQLRNIKRPPGSGFTSGNMPETQLSNMPSHESRGNIIEVKRGKVVNVHVGVKVIAPNHQ